MSQTPPREDDPIIASSLSWPILISSLLLLLALAWALYDEFYGLRPWRRYQRRFVQAYSTYLRKQLPIQTEAEKAIRASAEFQKLEEEMKAAEKAVGPRLTEMDRQLRLIDRQIAACTDAYQTARGLVTSLIYKQETAGSPRGREARARDVARAKRGPFRVDLPSGEGEKTEGVSLTYDELENKYNTLRETKAKLITDRAALLEEANQLRAQRDAYLHEHLAGLTPDQIKGLQRTLQKFDYDIKQINVADAQLVDRCQSCHLATDPQLVPPTIRLTKADLALATSKDAPFTSHPEPELLKIHNTEKFGCSPCHGGNGRATTSVIKAHGLYEHWLWPLFPRENFQAGCQQCHAADFMTDQAEVLNEGKEQFRLKGCIGCHRYEGFDNEPERLLAAHQQIRQLEQQKHDNEIEANRLTTEGDRAASNEEAERLYAKASNLRVSNSSMDAKIEELERSTSSLLREYKKVGPSLKEVRVKLRKEWLPVWIRNPHAWRPTTKMPRFRLTDEQVEAIAAFVWQSGVSGQLQKQPAGDPVRGKESFETRGCMACHSVGEGSGLVGGTFAANLTRVGEKDNYDYLVRWIHNPRERTLPYCPYEKKDITPADYQRHGLPFVFDLEHSRCPNDGHELQVQQMTVMPSLRLSWEEARDIASFLMTLKKQDPATYPAAPHLDDPKLKEKGQFWVKHFGCAGCHEIAGFEEEGRMGTELTTEGSKPLERLDFALLTRTAKREEWYDHKGFFEHKLENPAVFDQGKVKGPLEQLKMPQPNLTPEQRTAVVTFLLGSVDPTMPQWYYYRPADQRRDAQEGWWVVKKYNCMGCHQIRIRQKSVLMTLPRYQDPDWKEQLPPSLVFEGARVDPNWLQHFLENPAMSKTDTDRNGVRTYLKARMPTFSFSEGEIQKIVRFFEALSYQPLPYVPPRLVPLTPQEQMMARQLFTHPAAPCLKCHATGEAAHDRTATAPNFLLARERLKPAWTERWILDPQRMAPGTAMPSGLFKREGERWVFSGPLPPAFKDYKGDHADLLVRYMFQLTPTEQRMLTGRTSSLAKGANERKISELRALDRTGRRTLGQ